MTHRPLPYAVLLGGLAGALATVDVRVAAAVGLVAVTITVTTALGIERLTELAWLAAALLAPMNGLRVTSFAAFTDVALLVAASGTIFTAVATRRPVRLRTPDRGVLGGLMLVAISGLIGTVFAGDPTQSLLGMSKFVLASIGSLYAIGLWAASAQKLRRFTWAWLIGVLLSVGWAASGHSTKIVGRPEGLENHPNHLGLVCVLGFGLALGIAASSVGRERGVSRVAMAVLVGGALLSGSRAAVVGIIVVVPAWSMLVARWKLAVRCLGAVALLAIALGSGVVHLPANSGAQRLLGGATSAASDQARSQLFKDSIDRFARHPLTGEGFQFAEEAHNIYLQVLVVGGPLALLGLGLVVSSVLRPGLRIGAALRRGSIDQRLLLPLGMVAGYIGYLAASLFQNVLWDRYLWLFIAATLGLVAAVTDERDPSPATAEASPAPVP